MPRKRQDDESKIREDANETAFRVLQEATGERPKTTPPAERSDAEKDPQAVERGRKGGLRGGPARKANLTPKQRSAIARKAAKARWKPNNEG